MQLPGWTVRLILEEPVQCARFGMDEVQEPDPLSVEGGVAELSRIRKEHQRESLENDTGQRWCSSSPPGVSHFGKTVGWKRQRKTSCHRLSDQAMKRRRTDRKFRSRLRTSTNQCGALKLTMVESLAPASFYFNADMVDEQSVASDRSFEFSLGCQVDGTSDELEQSSSSKEKRNNQRTDIFPPANPILYDGMPRFPQFGNNYVQSFNSGRGGSMVHQMPPNMIPMNSSGLRFHPGTVPAMFPFNEAVPVGMGGIFRPVGNGLGFPASQSLMMPSQNVYVPPMYNAQTPSSGSRRSASNLKNFDIQSPSHHTPFYGNYSNPYFWNNQSAIGSVREGAAQQSWAPYTMQQLQQQQQELARSTTVALGKAHTPTMTQRDVHSSHSTKGSDSCSDVILPRTNTSKLEESVCGVQPKADANDDSTQSAVSALSSIESKASVAPSTSCHVSYPLISGRLSQTAKSSNEFNAKASILQLPLSKTPQSPIDEKPVVSTCSDPVRSVYHPSNIQCQAVRAGAPGYPDAAVVSAASLTASRYERFETKNFPPQLGLPDFGHQLWPNQSQQQSNVHLRAAPGFGEDRTMQPGLGYAHSREHRNPFWPPHQLDAGILNAQQFPSSGSSSVALTDLLQQHNLMQQRATAAESRSALPSSSHSESRTRDVTPVAGGSKNDSTGMFCQSASAKMSCSVTDSDGFDTPVSSISSSRTSDQSQMSDKPRSTALMECTSNTQALCVSAASSVVTTHGLSLTRTTSSVDASPIAPSLRSTATDNKEESKLTLNPISPPPCNIPSTKLPRASRPGGSTGENIEFHSQTLPHAPSPYPNSIPRARKPLPSAYSASNLALSSSVPATSSSIQAADEANFNFAPKRLTSSPSMQHQDFSTQDNEAMASHSQNYGIWLMRKDNLLNEEIRNLELQVAQRRKTKKSLMAKQRTAQKCGRELSKTDIMRLSETEDEQTRLLQQLHQCRKDARSHQSKVQEFRLKTLEHGIPDNSLMPHSENLQGLERERQLDHTQQFMCGPGQMDPTSTNESSSRFRQNPLPQLFDPNLSTFHNRPELLVKSPVRDHFSSSESLRNPCFPVQDLSFRPWLERDVGTKSVHSSNLGALQQLSPSCAYVKPGSGDWKHTKGDLNQLPSSNRHEGPSSPRGSMFQTQSSQFNFMDDETEKRLSREHPMGSGEQERLVTLDRVKLLSKMTESMPLCDKERNIVGGDSNWPVRSSAVKGPPLASPLQKSLSSPVQKSSRRQYSETGDKVTKKRRKLSVDSLSRAEMLHANDFEANLRRQFEQLQKLEPLSLVEPDVSPSTTLSRQNSRTDCGAGDYGRLVIKELEAESSKPLYRLSSDSLDEQRSGLSTNSDKKDKPLSCEDVNKSIVETKEQKSPVIGSNSHIAKQQANDQVSVTVTVNRSAAGDIATIISAIADMLRVAVPVKYEVDSHSHDMATGKYNHKVTCPSEVYKEHAVNLQSLVKARTKFCRYCATPSEPKRVRKEEPFGSEKNCFSSDDDDQDLSFCSMNCSLEFNKALRSATQRSNSLPLLSSGGQRKTNRANSIAATTNRHAASVRSDEQQQKKSAEDRIVPKLSRGAEPSEIRPLVQEKHRTKVKKWENVGFKRWSANLVKAKDKLRRSTTDQQNQAESPELRENNFCGIITASVQSRDVRKCAFCLCEGDGETDGAGRLINMDFDLWVHLNCALWSSEVYETMDGTLMNVLAAYARGQTLDCVGCGLKGATIACYRTRCINYYHLECARKDGVTFLENKTCFCRFHCPKALPATLLKSLAVCRKVAVDRDENRQVASMLRLDDVEDYKIRVGSLIVHSIGQLLPCQIQSGKFNSKDYVYPVGFKSTRYFWKNRQIHCRCRYVCEITEVDGKPSFTIKIKEPGKQDVIFTDSSCNGVWSRVFQPLEQLRHSSVLTSFFPNYICGEEMFGLKEPVIRRVIESLPGIELLHNFKFAFGKSSMYVFPLTINPTGCIRSEPRSKAYYKRSHTLLSSFKVHSSPAGSALLGSGEFSIQQFMKQFTLTKLQRYRCLKTEWRNNVYLRRSNIQGLGLFAARQLEPYTMVIEYIGELIRSEVCEIREKVYEQQNRGTYMFRVDENLVIDATMTGGPARYINHSCDPNCFTEVIQTERGNKIVITALKKINSGEELNYDYMFELEDDKKIPCLCGAAKCQKWMN